MMYHMLEGLVIAWGASVILMLCGTIVYYRTLPLTEEELAEAREEHAGFYAAGDNVVDIRDGLRH